MRQHKVIVVHIGHSLGGNAIYDAAYDLDQRNIPVELLVPFDKSPSGAEERPPCGELLPAKGLRQTDLAQPGLQGRAYEHRLDRRDRIVTHDNREIAAASCHGDAENRGGRRERFGPEDQGKQKESTKAAAANPAAQ
jgi:thioesterase domain-containing protein